MALSAAAVLTGCNGLDRLLGNEDKEKPHGSGGVYVVACCMDNNATGSPTYPAFLPASHVATCQQVRAANHRDESIDGNIYLAVGAGCGQGKGYVGDEFYVGRGY